MITQIPTSLTHSINPSTSPDLSKLKPYTVIPTRTTPTEGPKSLHPSPTESQSSTQENRTQIQCYLCYRKCLTSKKHFRCKGCSKIICKIHSVSLKESRSFRICDNCEEVRLNTYSEDLVIDEKKYVMRQKIRYHNEEIERKQHDINFKSLCISKLQSIIKKSQADWEARQLDLLDKIQREKAQNDRLEMIAENLQKAVQSSQENTSNILQAHDRYILEIDYSQDQKEIITKEISTLMSEVDKFNQSLKKKVPIYKLSSLTCPNCCSEILKTCKTQEGSFTESSGRISRNMSIMEKLHGMEYASDIRCSQPCKCLMF